MHAKTSHQYWTTVSATLLLALCFGQVLFAQAQTQNIRPEVDHASVLAPYVDDQTVLVAAVDVSKIDVDATVAFVMKLAPALENEKQRIDFFSSAVKTWLTNFKKSGGQYIYAVLSLSDIGKKNSPALPFFLVIPFAEGGDANAIRTLIPTKSRRNFPLQKAVRIPAKGPLVFGSLGTLERLGKQQAKPAKTNRKLSTAFEAIETSPLKIVFIPTEDHRRVLREMFPKLPKPLDTIDGKVLADGIVWKAVGIDVPPAFKLRSVVQSKDAASAKELAAAWKQVLTIVARHREIRSQIPNEVLQRLTQEMQPVVEGSQVVVTIKQETTELVVKKLMLPIVHSARAAARRNSRINNFKQLALAMHNWASTHENDKSNNGKRRGAHFPANAIYSKEGKPLLSWRVALLPYVDSGGGMELYKQFHLDEPWDSKHNKKLIAKMPAVFQDPGLSEPFSKRKPQTGYTTFVVPVGKGLVFGRKVGTTFREIKDGTSQTIMIVEVTPENAVPWTKPADWIVPKIERDPKTFTITKGNPLLGVKRSDRNTFNAAYCDGSVRTIANAISPSEFYKLLTRSGGEVIKR